MTVVQAEGRAALSSLASNEGMAVWVSSLPSVGKVVSSNEAAPVSGCAWPLAVRDWVVALYFGEGV